MTTIPDPRDSYGRHLTREQEAQRDAVVVKLRKLATWIEQKWPELNRQHGEDPGIRVIEEAADLLCREVKIARNLRYEAAAEARRARRRGSR